MVEKEDFMKRRDIGIFLLFAGLLVVLFACAGGGGLAPEGWKRVQFVIPGCG